jgi:hypothetical protein
MEMDSAQDAARGVLGPVIDTGAGIASRMPDRSEGRG